MKKDKLTEALFLKKKSQEALQKTIGCKFIRINTSNAKNGYNLDNQVGNVQTFTDEFKNKKIKKTRRQKKGKIRKIKQKTERTTRQKQKFKNQPNY